MSPMINTNIITKFNDHVLTSKPMEKMYRSIEKNPAKFAAQMALVSALTKDAVGCYYYVTQSLHNERIPEEKRKFVASIDLMNGILNVALQFTIGKWVEKKAPKWFESLVEKKLKTDDTRKTAVSIRETIQDLYDKNKLSATEREAAEGLLDLDKKAAKELLDAGKDSKSFKKVEHYLRETLLGSAKKGKVAKWLNVGFSAASVLVATQIITKRVFVPYLATPLASWYKKRFLDKDKPNALPGRVYWEWQAMNGSNKMDKTAFSKVSMK